MLKYPFDERFRYYGYEDVLLGKTLKRHRVPIRHIDNPMGFCAFETNAYFVANTDEGLRTLYQFRNDLEGYNGLLAISHRLRLLTPLIDLWHWISKGWEYRLLAGNSPSLTVFALYRLGYFMSLKWRKN